MSGTSTRIACLTAVAVAWLWGAPAAAHPGVHDGIAEATRRLDAGAGASDLLARAELHRIAGELDQAERDLAGAAERDPTLEGLALCRAALDFDRGRLDEALAGLDRHLARRPDDPRARTLRARVLARAGHPLEAARDLGLALERIPSPGPDLVVEMAALLVQAGPQYLDDALTTVLVALQRSPSVPSLELAAVDLLEARGDLQAALARLDRMGATLERPAAWLARRARLLERLGDAEGARWAAAAAAVAGRTAESGSLGMDRSGAAASGSAARGSTSAAAEGGTAARVERGAAAARIAAVVARGPYLLEGGPDRVTIRWRTDVATTGRVRYGTSLASLGGIADDPASSTEHEITLTGLAANTRYYYSVGTGSLPLAGGDADHTFVTAPVPGTPKPTRIWVIGDSGTANTNAAAVRDAFAAYGASRPADLWLMLGDNAYSSGTDAQYQAAVFAMYPALLRTTVLWPTRGNHDLVYAGANNDYYDIFSLPTAAEVGGLPSGTEAYYSFDYANVHFVCLDSEGSSRTVGGPMAVWLRADLAATPRDWVIAFWHHPTYSKGSHDSDNDLDSGGRMRDMRQNILPILDSAGVDVVLFGHSHSYERSFLLDGHYGPSNTLTAAMKVDDGDGRWNGDGAYLKPTLGTAPHEGCVYAVNGVAGQASGGSLNHPVMVRSLNVLGSMVVDVEGPRLDARFLDSQGAVRDSFTIVKGSPLGVPGEGESGRTGLRILGPHPARGAVRFGYRLESPARPRLAVLDALGRRVRVVEAESREAGDHELAWDGRDDGGRTCPQGVYFAVLEAGTRTWARKVVRLGP
jgi:tetratricopeptide (TPR) repeat protein